MVALPSGTLGSWMNPWPDRTFGGSSPVQACFKHSMTVCGGDSFHVDHQQHKWFIHRMHRSCFKRCRIHVVGRTHADRATMTYRLSSTILAHNEGERSVKLNDMLVAGAKAAHALDEELVDGAHDVTLPGCYMLYIIMFRLSAAREALSIVRNDLIGLGHQVFP